MIDRTAFFYPHTCVITRYSGVDASTGVVNDTSVYSGACGLNIGNSGDTTLKGNQLMSAYKVIIPTNTVVLAKEDKIVVTSENGRITKSTIEDFDPCSWAGLEGITIWLSKGVDT
jgi:hypothetical protein